MRTRNAITKGTLTITLLFVLTGCSRTIDDTHTANRKGLLYVINEDSPYTGTVIKKYNNGQIAKKLQYSNGILNGDYEEYFHNGQLKKKASYKNGKYYDTNVVVFRNQKGDKKSEILYEDEKLKHCRQWSNQGKLLNELHFDENEQPNGEAIVWGEKVSIDHGRTATAFTCRMNMGPCKSGAVMKNPIKMSVDMYSLESNDYCFVNYSAP